MTHARTEVDWSKPGAGDGRCLTCQHRGVRMKHWLSFPVSLLAGHLERHHRATESTDAGWVGSVLDQVQSVRADYAGQVGEKTGAPLTVWQAWIMAEKAVMRDRAARVQRSRRARSSNRSTRSAGTRTCQSVMPPLLFVAILHLLFSYLSETHLQRPRLPFGASGASGGRGYAFSPPRAYNRPFHSF